MLSRLVRIQLILFSIASVVGVTVMVVGYLQAPTLLGIGRYTVSLELPEGGGLYRFSNVTVRGVQVGKVTDLVLTPRGPRATLSLQTSPKIPADLSAEVRSVSAVGEQYVDLQPHTDTGPYLGQGSVIPASTVTVPQKVGPMLDRMSALLGSIPKDRIADLLDETSQALGGADFDLGSLIDSSATLGEALRVNSDAVSTLTDDSVPLLDSQQQTTDSLRQWANELAGVTRQIDENDAAVRNILEVGPGAADEATRLLSDVRPTLPLLLANLTTVGQIAMTYRPGVEQLLVLFPPYIAALQGFALPWNNPTGWPLGDFTATSGDPPACTVGFLPASQWRSPADLTDIDTPDNLFCKLPQDSPIAVRGARNTPCLENPGKRAPTVEICRSDQPYRPLALRQHALGPNPIDPSAIAQGIPPDDRILPGEDLYGPVEGTPLPPGAVTSPPAPVPAPASPGPSMPSVPAAAPATNAIPQSAASGPVAFAQYDPASGRYVTPDGQTHEQSDLVTGGSPRTWRDLMPN
jgi:virulence factor Mce-like protein